MGLIGLVLASLAQMFLQLPGLSFIISILGVFIFAGLIAYDTQQLEDELLRNGRRPAARWRWPPTTAR